jgi:hypothetical protein
MLVRPRIVRRLSARLKTKVRCAGFAPSLNVQVFPFPFLNLGPDLAHTINTLIVHLAANGIRWNGPCELTIL